MILISKVSKADTLFQYRPIFTVNFKFKNVSKILVERLAQILQIIISTGKKNFILSRQIEDCVGLASEAINMFQYKFSLTFKVDNL